jgi:hypothetical protein
MPTPKIKPVPGEPLRFHVRSNSRPDFLHLVDLQANRMVGWCSCEDWQARRGPALRERLPAEDCRCHHIRAVREWLLNKFLDQIVEQTGLVEEKID